MAVCAQSTMPTDLSPGDVLLVDTAVLLPRPGGHLLIVHAYSVRDGRYHRLHHQLDSLDRLDELTAVPAAVAGEWLA